MLETGQRTAKVSDTRFVNHTEKLEINMLFVEAETKDHK